MGFVSIVKTKQPSFSSTATMQKEKQEASNEIQKHIAEFLAKGGKITVEPIGKGKEFIPIGKQTRAEKKKRGEAITSNQRSF